MMLFSLLLMMMFVGVFKGIFLRLIVFVFFVSFLLYYYFLGLFVVVDICVVILRVFVCVCFLCINLVSIAVLTSLKQVKQKRCFDYSNVPKRSHNVLFIYFFILSSVRSFVLVVCLFRRGVCDTSKICKLETWELPMT